eukprot:6244061-Amphidinium_carterae.1
MSSHLTLEQAVAADIPATYYAGNAMADTLASEAVQTVLALPPSLTRLSTNPTTRSREQPAAPQRREEETMVPPAQR